jgi:hypothetical protein
VWLAAARRFFTLLGVLVGAVFLCAVSVGLLLGTSLNRSIAVAFEAFGCLCSCSRSSSAIEAPCGRGEAAPFILRWATPENQSTIAEWRSSSAEGIVLIVIGPRSIRVTGGVIAHYQRARRAPRGGTATQPTCDRAREWVSRLDDGSRNSRTRGSSAHLHHCGACRGYGRPCVVPCWRCAPGRWSG